MVCPEGLLGVCLDGGAIMRRCAGWLCCPARCATAAAVLSVLECDCLCVKEARVLLYGVEA